MRTLGKLGLLTGLYLAQGLPYGFFTQSIPVLLREQQVSLTKIGLTALLALPWALKFLWAPLVDRWPPALLGRRRGFILPVQALTIAVLLAAAVLEPSRDMGAILALVFVVNLLSATQDIAADGLAVETLTAGERGLGNGVQVAAYRVGMVIGGGALLVVYEHLGWDLAFAGMAALLALTTLPVALKREAPTPEPAAREPVWQGLVDFITRDGMGKWLLALVLYKCFDAAASAMLRPFLVDVGKTAGDVGVLVGIVGFVAGLAGALIGGALANPLGRRRALLVFGLLQGLAVLTYAVAAWWPTDAWLYVSVTFDHFAGGLATVALFTMMMDRARVSHAGTDYTVQASVVVLATGVSAALSGVLADAVGYVAHFGITGALTLVGTGVVVLALVREENA
jgi:MFS family permease